MMYCIVRTPGKGEEGTHVLARVTLLGKRSKVDGPLHCLTWGRG